MCYRILKHWNEVSCRYRMLCKSLIRDFSTSSCLFMRGRNKFRNAAINNFANPGIQKQIDAYHEVEKYAKVEEFDLDDMESDFMSVHKLYDKHKKETKAQKENIKLEIVKRKYFKKSSPNMLMWAEKEHIRYLHNQDCEEWCAEKLSQCFPATEDIVKRILKAKWQPEDAERILRHDSLVKQNWEKLKRGILQMDPALKKHLMKFTQRSENKMEGVAEWMKNTSVKHDARKPKSSVFAQIINSYCEIKEKSTQDFVQRNAVMLTSGREKDAETAKTELFLPQKLVGKEAPMGGSFLLKTEGAVTEQPPVTLTKYKEQILNSAVELGERDISMIKEKGSSHALEKESANVQDVRLSALQRQDTFITRIWIPKEKRKKGGTYKVNDYYFDNDGSFLYRVPGMTK